MANETTPAKSWLDTLGGWVTTAGQIVTGATTTYVAAQQRLEALKSIDEDTVAAQPATTPKVVTGGIPSNLPSWVIPSAIAVGVVVLIIIVRKLR